MKLISSLSCLSAGCRSSILIISPMILVVFGLSTPAPSQPQYDSSLTVVYLVRHAEATYEKHGVRVLDTDQNGKGVDRANKLVPVLESEEIAAVYVTGAQRAKETGTPIAKKNSIEELSFYTKSTNPPEYDRSPDENKIQKLVQDYAGKRVLIVGHSDTASTILKYLGATETDQKRVEKMMLIDRRHDLLIHIVIRGDASKVLSLSILHYGVKG